MPLSAHLSIPSMLMLAQAEYERANACVAEYRCALELGQFDRAEELRGRVLHHMGESLDQFAMAFREIAKS